MRAPGLFAPDSRMKPQFLWYRQIMAAKADVADIPLGQRAGDRDGLFVDPCCVSAGALALRLGFGLCLCPRSFLGLASSLGFQDAQADFALLVGERLVPEWRVITDAATA